MRKTLLIFICKRTRGLFENKQLSIAEAGMPNFWRTSCMPSELLIYVTVTVILKEGEPTACCRA